jgi:hypothetical protein
LLLLSQIMIILMLMRHFSGYYSQIDALSISNISLFTF